MGAARKMLVGWNALVQLLLEDVTLVALAPMQMTMVAFQVVRTTGGHSVVAIWTIGAVLDSRISIESIRIFVRGTLELPRGIHVCVPVLVRGAFQTTFPLLRAFPLAGPLAPARDASIAIEHIAIGAFQNVGRLVLAVDISR